MKAVFADNNLKKKLFLMIVLLIVIIPAGILLLNLLHGGNQAWSLRVEDPRNGIIYYDLEVKANEIFTFSLRNSVSKSVVTGTILITEDGLLEPLTTAFTSYGPGLPMEFVEEYSIEDGIITVFHNEEPRENIRLWANPQTEETIYLRGQPYTLSTLADNSILLEIWIFRPAGTATCPLGTFFNFAGHTGSKINGGAPK